MSPEEINALYITVPEIMADADQDRGTVRNWLMYHRYMPYENVLGRPVVRREVYADFKQKHPELIKAPISA